VICHQSKKRISRARTRKNNWRELSRIVDVLEVRDVLLILHLMIGHLQTACVVDVLKIATSDFLEIL